MKYLLPILVLLASVQSAHPAPVFGDSFESFKSALDGRVKADTTDKALRAGVKRCKNEGTKTVCVFYDAAFQASVAAMKQLDLLNGRFEQNLRVTVETSNGKITSIRLNGNRGDPANLFEFLGTVMNVIQVFDPKAGTTDADLKEYTEQLGLMRGDSANDIGKERTMIKPYALIKCMAVPSSLTANVACEWTPRS